MNKAAVKMPSATDGASANKPKAPSAEDFSHLSRKRLEAMAEAAEMVVDCHRVLAKTGDNIVGELIKDIETFFEWDHYPDGDIFDPETYSQFYYHAHAAEERKGEHGHFHTFLRPGGMPKGVKPAPLPDFEPPEDPDVAFEAHARQVHEDYLSLRKQFGESTSNISFEAFFGKVAKTRSDMVARHGCRDVRLEAYEKAGRAALRITPLR